MFTLFVFYDISGLGGIMSEEKYYIEIKKLIENYEVNHRVRNLQDNSEKLRTNWNIGRLLIEAQGGLNRAKYGDGLIKQWSIAFMRDYGKYYNVRELRRMRQFYLLFSIWSAVPTEISWSHIIEILSLKNKNEMNYYINQVILNHLSTRELRSMIKSKAYDRLSYADKENIQLIDVNNPTSLTIEDMIKDPILIKVNKELNKLDEKALHQYIIHMLENRFLELGTGFALIGHEYKIIIDHHTFKIDLLFFNVNLNAYVVVEIKTREYHPKDIGQLEFYVDYVDKNMKLSNHNKTIGLLIVRKKNKYVIEYVTNKEIYVTTYKLI